MVIDHFLLFLQVQVLKFLTMLVQKEVLLYDILNCQVRTTFTGEHGEEGSHGHERRTRLDFGNPLQLRGLSNQNRAKEIAFQLSGICCRGICHALHSK